MSNIELPNPHLKHLKVDYYYHLGLDSSMDIKKMFGKTKVVLMGGSVNRMQTIAERLVKELDLSDEDKLPAGSAVAPIGKTERYSLFRVGPVICVNHGMGMPSMLILLHEISKMLVAAGATDFVFIRIGTSGGLGIPAGSVVVTTEAVNDELEAVHVVKSLGKAIKRPTKIDKSIVEEIVSCAKKFPELNVVQGMTMGTDDFYEGQCRLDGAICLHGDDEKMEYLKAAHGKGVRNIEMEAVAFASFCNTVNIRGAVLCCTLLNRFEGDQVKSTPKQLGEFADNVITVAIEYIKRATAETSGDRASKRQKTK